LLAEPLAVLVLIIFVAFPSVLAAGTPIGFGLVQHERTIAPGQKEEAPEHLPKRDCVRADIFEQFDDAFVEESTSVKHLVLVFLRPRLLWWSVGTVRTLSELHTDKEKERAYLNFIVRSILPKIFFCSHKTTHHVFLQTRLEFRVKRCCLHAQAGKRNYVIANKART
jgi:hypothetical protein